MRHKLFGLLTALCVCMVVLCVSASAMEISVEMPDGKTLALEVEPGDSIDNVKQKICDQISIPTASQYLYFRGKLLSTGRTLADYNIQKESVLWISENEVPEPSGTPLTNDNIANYMTLSSGTYCLDGGYSVRSIDITSPLTITGNVTLDLNGYVLKMTGAGSVIYVEPGATLTLTDSKPRAVHKFTVGENGLWVLNENDGARLVHGGAITGGSASNGGGVHVKTGGQLTITGGNIVGCSATDVGGGVYLNGLNGTVDQTTFTMNGGSITGCLAANTDGGGGVNVAQGTFTMNGGSITECTASSSGGGVHIRNGGSFTMTGGAIQNCKSGGSRSNGGGVYVGRGQFTMNGGSITGCRAEGTSGNEEFARGGGVYNCGGDFTMNGGSVESDCTADGSGGGVYNEKKLYANGGEIAGDVVNGIPGQTTGTITGSGGTKFSGKVTNNKGDNGSKSVIECGTFTGTVTNNGAITGGTFTGEVTGSGSITGATVVAVSASDALRAALEGGDSAVIKLSADIKIDTSLTVSRTVTLDLNGCVLRVTSDYNSVIEVKDGGALTLTDSSPSTTHYYSVDPDTKLWTILSGDTGAAGSIQGGIITGGSTGLGGGVWIRTGGTLTMNGGAIAGCRANSQGGGVYVYGGGTFTMNGGTIAGCVADFSGGENQGGGVYVCNGRKEDKDKNITELARGVFTMNNGSIIDCAARDGMGGSVYIVNGVSGSDYYGLFTMNGGSISDSGVTGRDDYNTIYNIGTFIANGGTVTNSGSGRYNYALYTIGILETEQGFSGTEFFGAAFNGINSDRFDGGIFNGQVLNYDRISGGVFKSDVINDDSEIAGGKFCGTVTNRNNGRITGGVFESGSTVINDGDKPRCGIIIGGTFNGSVTNDGKITGGAFYGTVSGDGTIETSATHTVSFDTDGGSAVDAQKILRGQKATEPAACEKAGYNFAGWYKDASVYDFTTPVLEDFTLRAAWTANQYTITFDSDGGSTVTSITQDCGTAIIAPANPTRNGYTFTGWHPAIPAAMPAGDLTVKALWSANSYAITYDLDGGTAEGNPDSYTIETENITLNAPTKAGYTFTGWSGTGLTGENNMTVTIEKGSIGDRSYTAHWRYNGGGGNSSSPSYPVSVPDKTDHGSVTVSPKNASKGDTVTITVKPDSGYVLETISVTDKNNNDLKLTDKGNGKYNFTMPGSKVEVKVTFMEDNSVLNFFYDVPNDAYYYEAVKWAAENGITGGVGNSLFAPNQPCTRAQIVTFLWRVAGSPVVNYLMPFTDVDEGAYYAEAVRWAASSGIVTGLTETTFGADGVCTRAQAAAMIYRYAQAQGKGFTGAWMFLLPFTDVPEWAYESVAWCYMNGVTTGVSETAFAPDNDCTRAQIVTFLWRAFRK